MPARCKLRTWYIRPVQHKRGIMTAERPPRRRIFDKRAILREHPIFGALGPELADRLAAHAVSQTVKRGATIFSRGDPGTSLFAVCSGAVKISAPSAEGKDALFNVITEGAIFGEVAVLDGRSRTADASAITDCELMVIERRDFIALVHERPEFALALIEVLCGRLRQTTEQLEDIMFLDLPGRLAKTLLHLIKGAKLSPSGPKVTLTQSDIGKIIGMSRESTNKQLRAWQDRKWLLLERGGIVILNPEALAEVAATAGD